MVSRTSPPRSRARQMALGSMVTVPLITASLLSALVMMSKGKALPLPLAEVVGPARLSNLRFAFAANRGVVDDRLASQAREALSAMPLSSEPFLMAAMRDFPTPNSLGNARAEPLLAEVIRRNPRSRPANLLMFRRHVASGQLEPTLLQLSRLNRLEPDTVGSLLQKLGQQIATPELARELAVVLRSRPELFDNAAAGIAASPADSRIVATFVANASPKALAQSTAKPALIDRLLRDGRSTEARQLWALGQPAASAAALVQDPGFAQGQSRPPFGWTYTQSGVGVAERQAGEGVYVEFFGRTPGELLSQALTLAPGSYKGTVSYSIQAGGNAALVATVDCYGGGSRLAEVRLGSGENGRGRITVPFVFTVPAGCDSQTLAVSGQMRDNRKGQSVILHSLNVAAGGR